MLIFYFLILVILFSIIFLFSSPKLSPIPYFPSQPVDLPLIVKALNLKNNLTVFDLGAGDGIVIFSAAENSYHQKLDTKFIAVEINPVLILILHLRRLFHPNKKNIKIFHGNIFKMVYKNFTYESDAPLPYNITIYLYISPWYLEKTILNVKEQISKFKIVSYMYPIKSLKKKGKIIQGKNRIFSYN